MHHGILKNVLLISLLLMKMRGMVEQQLGLSSNGEVPEFRGKNGERMHDATVEAIDRILAREYMEV